MMNKAIQLTIKYFLCDTILMIRETEGREERSKVARMARTLLCKT